MAQGRLTLDDPIFAETLRYSRHNVPAYQARPTHPQTKQDMMFVRSSRASSANGPGAASVSTAPAAVPRAHKHRSSETVALRPRQVPSAPAPKTETPSHKTRRKQHRRIGLPSMVLYAMAGMLFMAGGYVAFSSLRTDNHVKAQVQQLQKAAATAEDTGDTPTDEKPTATAIAKYTVAPALARYLDIPKLSVHARVMPLGIKSDNTLKAPRNGYDVGWYDASSRPGENGAMLIDGHSNVLGKKAVFAKLGKLTTGDSLKITRGDGQVLTYKVRSVQTVDDDKVDMSQLLVSADTAKPGLNLITCAGDVIPGTLHLDKRTFVQAVLE